MPFISCDYCFTLEINCRSFILLHLQKKSRSRKELMDQNKLKEGISVKEIESFAKKHRFEVFFCVSFILACLFSFVFFTAWSLIFAVIGAILGIFMQTSVQAILKKIVQFVVKQEQTTQIVLAIVTWIVSMFLPPLVFLLIGASGGNHLAKTANESAIQGPQG
jgi:ABC-type amino acid transport system permease subunit